MVVVRYPFNKDCERNRIQGHRRNLEVKLETDWPIGFLLRLTQNAIFYKLQTSQKQLGVKNRVGNLEVNLNLELETDWPVSF